MALFVAYLIVCGKKRRASESREKAAYDSRMVADDDTTRYEKEEAEVPRFPTTQGRHELEGTEIHEMSTGDGKWLGERLASPRLDDPRNVHY